MNSVLAIISGIGAVQSFLFALLIILKKQRKLPDWVLLIWFLLFSMHLSMIIADGVYSFFIIEILITTVGFLPAPFFFIYTKSIFNQKLHKQDYLHFGPFFIITIISFFINPNEVLLWEIIMLILKLASFTIYPLYILFTYHKNIKFFKINGSGKNKTTFSWIKTIAILFLLSTAVSIFRLSTELIVGERYFEIWDILRYVILITVIGFYGLKFGMVYHPEVTPEIDTNGSKYKHSPLKNNDITTLIDRINLYFKENETYLESDFSLSVLSEALDIPKHHLSQIINSEMNTTFYDLMNSKRIEYAMRVLKNGNKTNLSLEGLGYECGYNSKSAFFHHFKKHTGKTPGKFKKEISTD